MLFYNRGSCYSFMLFFDPNLLIFIPSTEVQELLYIFTLEQGSCIGNPVVCVECVKISTVRQMENVGCGKELVKEVFVC